MIPCARIHFPFCSNSARQYPWTYIRCEPSAINTITKLQATWRFVTFLSDDVESQVPGTRQYSKGVIRDPSSGAMRDQNGIERNSAED